MRQVLGPGALGRPRGIGWRGSWEGGSGWGIHVTPWLIHVNVWPNPLQYCEMVGLQLIKINEKKKWSESESCSVVSDSLRPHGLHGPRNSPGQNTGVGGYSLLQGIFPTQGSNPGLPHCRRILYNKMELGKLSPLSVAEFPHLWNWDDNKTSLMVLLWLNKSIRKVLHESIPNVSQGWCYYCSSHPNSGYISASAPLLCVKKHQIWIVTGLNIQKIFLSS